MAVKQSKYNPHTPSIKQQAFLWLDCLDAFYGGSAGGGKSDALLAAALQYVDIPLYNAVLIRDTYQNLTKPGGLLDRAHEWLHGTDAKWVGDTKSYIFPSGARVSFSYLDGPLDHFNHQGSEYQMVGIDEVVNVRENQAVYMFSRMRKLRAEQYRDELKSLPMFSHLSDNQIENYYQGYKNIPLRFRCTSNPPTYEQLARGAWVKARYVDKETRKDRVFIPAGLDDNEFIDESYVKSLDQLDPVTRKQLKEGDWNIKVKGRMFDREWFKIVDVVPEMSNTVRFWDLASTEPSKANKDPDYTAGCKLSRSVDGRFYIEHVQRHRKSPQENKEIIYQAAKIDGKMVEICFEKEPGSSGKYVVDDFIRAMSGWMVSGEPSTGSKRQRAMPFASQAEAGNVYIVNGTWVENFLDEIESFPDGKHDDQVDAVSGAFKKLTEYDEVNIRYI